MHTDFKLIRLSIVAITLIVSTHYVVGQNLMPMPSSILLGSGFLRIDSSFTVRLLNPDDETLTSAARRFVERLMKRTGIPMSEGIFGGEAIVKLSISCRKIPGKTQSAVEDESYTLTVAENGAELKAETRLGVLRGLETFLQLIEIGSQGFQVRCLTIEDKPRFAWRGLLIDACRHWMPTEVIKRNLDGMAMMKMNVLHWHLSEDQGFRAESKKFPKLHGMGSDGNYYTQEQIKEVISYAADRGIRVVPEFDMPGHSTAWFVGYPELASAPGPYHIERKWGVFDPAMDPTREETYKFLDEFIGEMAKLFPDEYFHIGGDEVNGKQWDANLKIQEFKRKNNLEDNHALQAYFNRRVLAILKKHGKKMIGWDEIFHPDLPKDIVVQSWRGQKSLAEGAKQGYQGILSFGYYLDHIRPALYHYSIDPIDSTIAGLTKEEQSRILGGEACMWTEYVSPENVDSRIWPRTAAIAERLWSPASVRDADAMYRRLEVVSKQLEYVGLTHRISYTQMLERLAGNNSIEPLKVLADVVEPVKFYERGKTREYTSLTPLNRLVDAARPESNNARILARLLSEFQENKISNNDRTLLNDLLTLWKENHAKLEPLLANNQLLDDVEPLSRDLADVSVIALKLMETFASKENLTEGQTRLFTAILQRAEKQKGALLLMVVPPVKKLFESVQK